MSKQLIAEAVAAGNAEHGERRIGFGFLGNGSGTVVADQSSRMVYYYQDAITGQRGIFTAKLWDQSGIPLADIDPGDVIEVVIGYPPGEQAVHVLRQTEAGKAATGGFTLAEQKANANAQPQATVIQDLRVVPLAGFIEAKVLLGHYHKPSTGGRKIFEDNTRNEASGNTLTILQAELASGEHRIAWLFLDKEEGKLRVVASDPKTALDILPSRTEFTDPEYEAISRPNSACKDLTPVYLYYGQTELGNDDVIYRWDMRFDNPIESNDASSGGSIVTANGNRLLTANGNTLKAA